MKKSYIIFLTLAAICASYLLFNEIKMRPKYNLVNDAKKIQKIIEKEKLDKKSSEIVINDGFRLKNKEYKVKGEGVIFLEKEYSIFLGNDEMCAIKLPYGEDIMFQNEPCPTYKMFSGLKFKVVNKGYGLYQENNEYVFKGNYQNNYCLYDNAIFQILKFDNEEITFVTDQNPFNNLKELKEADYKKTLTDSSYIDYKTKKYYTKSVKSGFTLLSGTGTELDPHILN